MVAAAALILAVDAERMVRRATEDPAEPRIRISLAHNSDDDMNKNFVGTVFGYLQTRAIRVEPESWGSSVSIVRA